jgi:hypothetical protein
MRIIDCRAVTTSGKAGRLFLSFEKADKLSLCNRFHESLSDRHYDGCTKEGNSPNSWKSVIIEPSKGRSVMTLKYTEAQLNQFNKETIIQLFLAQQEQLESIDQKLQLVLEQVSNLNRHRFGRASESTIPKTRFLLWKLMGRSYSLMKPKQLLHKKTKKKTTLLAKGPKSRRANAKKI